MKQVRDFRFKQFTVSQQRSTHKVGTDGVLLGAWASVTNCKTILDIGTGSGVIALMLAQRTSPNVMIDAVEMQHEDAEQARENVAQSPWHNRVTIHEVAVQNFLPGKKYDLIVSNPPFFINSSLPPKESRTKVRHTETLTFQDLVKSVVGHLSETGIFALILPPVEASQFQSLAKDSGLFLVRECQFRARVHKPVERVLMEFATIQKPLLLEDLVLYSDGDEWSLPYQQLTREFYLKL